MGKVKTLLALNKLTYSIKAKELSEEYIFSRSRQRRNINYNKDER